MKTAVMEKPVSTITIDQNDISSIESYGEEYSNTLVSLSDSLATSETKLKSLGEIGDNITSLMSTVKTLDPNVLNEQPNFFQKLFGITKDNVSKFIDSQKSVEEVVSNVSQKLLDDRESLIQENVSLEKVYEDTFTTLENMDKALEYGNGTLEKLNEELENMKNTVDQTPEMALTIQSKAQFIERLSQKISRLNNAKALVVRQLPQIRMIQTGNNTEIDTIKDVVDVAIPLWKSQIGLFISQLKTKHALDNRKNVTTVINDTIQQNAILMNQNVDDIADGYSSDIISIDTIKTVQENLISSINTMSNVTAVAQEKRKQSFAEIAQMDNELKTIVMK